MSLVNQDSDIQINILSSEVSSLRAEITELKKIVLELQYGKKRGPKKKKNLIIKQIKLIDFSNDSVRLSLNNEIEWKTTLSNLDNIIDKLKHNTRYEINY